MVLRQSPSGPDIELTTDDIANQSNQPGVTATDALDQLSAVGPLVSSLNSTLASPVVLPLLASGHTPGIYLIGSDIIARSPSPTGTLSRLVSYSAPIFGLTTLSGAAVSIAATSGHLLGAIGSVAVCSDGTAPITITWTPAGITGSPLVDFYNATILLASL